MPRQSRIDAPGALHHVIARGIACRRVFNDDADADFFVKRLGLVLSDTQTHCFAWALMPNHFHLLLKTGATPIAGVMKRLLKTGAFSGGEKPVGSPGAPDSEPEKV
jgi:putative transposase